MNFFLYINRRIIIFFSLILTILFIGVILNKQLNFNNIEVTDYGKQSSKADIYEPKFAINNNTKKIFVTAKEGNFLNKDEILLNENVRFTSNDFSIETEKVIFDRNKQTAKSKTKSLFKSKNTIISSNGFNIYDSGNKITFYGNSIIILK